MSRIYRQAAEPSSKKSNDLDKHIDKNLMFKHFLKCNSCLWEITIYESAGSSKSINSKKIRCPLCKEKEINSTKIKIIS